MTLPRRLPAALALALVVAPIVLPRCFAGKRAAEPEVVVVQHLLIGFKRSVEGKKIDRTKQQAEALAAKLLERARAGEDFDALVREFTDDSPPGIFTVTNDGAPRRSGASTRDSMVRRFGDVAFALAVGEFGLAAYHPSDSPYGWHVIKRLE
jgi:hypothetical protein